MDVILHRNTITDRSLLEMEGEGKVCCRRVDAQCPIAVERRPKDQPGQQSCTKCRLSVLFQYLDQALMHEIDANQAANLLHLSKSRMRHVFTSQIGMPFHQYIIRLRVQRGYQLLCVEGRSMEQTAVTLNIYHLSHFLRDFKRLYGGTPRQLRRAFLEFASLSSGIETTSSHDDQSSIQE